MTATPILKNETAINRPSKYLSNELKNTQCTFILVANMAPRRHLLSFDFNFYVKSGNHTTTKYRVSINFRNTFCHSKARRGNYLGRVLSKFSV